MRGSDGIASKPPPPGETAATSTTAYTPLRIAAEISPEEVVMARQVMAVLKACPLAASVPDIKGEPPCSGRSGGPSVRGSRWRVRRRVLSRIVRRRLLHLCGTEPRRSGEAALRRDQER